MELSDIRVLSMIRTLASDIAARAMFAGAAGSTFGGLRDVDAALGYKKDLEYEDFERRYKRGDIAGRVVEAKPHATWRGQPELIEDEDPDVITTFEEEWLKLDERLHVWATFLNADIMSGIGRYGVILIGAPGNFDAELKKATADDIKYLKVFPEKDVEIKEDDIVADPKDPRFGRLNFYTIKRIGGRTTGVGGRGQRVHWTRIIHVADGLLENNIYGEPRLQRVWNRLDDLEKVVGGGSEAFWLQARQGLHFNLDKDMKVTEDNRKKMEEETDKFVHGLERVLRTKGMEVNTLGSDVANFGPVADAILTIIAGSTGIPKRILTGSEMGELASSQDRSNWGERIADRRTQYASPYMVRQFVDRLIMITALPTPTQYRTRWPEAANLTLNERATMGKTWAEINSTQGEDVVTSNEIRDLCLGLDRREELEDGFVPEEEEVPGGPEDQDVPPDDQEAAAQEEGGGLRTAKRRLKYRKLRDKKLREAISRRAFLRRRRKTLREDVLRPADLVSDEEDARQQHEAQRALRRSA